MVAICEQRPRSIDELASIPGIGARKLELYGVDLLRITDQYLAENTERSPEIDPA
ncbi:MAG TPA: HRDC domain-containing protein [Gammaproteobacteria bacterium]|nr:HRDC domain-containing protein [Gammaproteobacteria bacterium]